MRNEERLLTTLNDLVRPQHTGLAIVDMQNDFCHKDGFFGKGIIDKRGYGQKPADLSMVQEASPNIRRLVDAARTSGVKIYFVHSFMDDRYLPPMLRLRKIRIGRNAVLVPEGLWGSEPFDGLVPKADDTVIIKHGYSAFIGTDFLNILEKASIETLIITGVATNICCETTIRDGCCAGYYIIAPQDCLCTYSRIDQERSLADIDTLYGIVTTSQEIIECWKSGNNNKEGG
jgi:ureidoacrylate peracid hydrolase